MIGKKHDPHKSQWESLEKKNLNLSKEKDDFFARRAQSCRNLLIRFC